MTPQRFSRWFTDWPSTHVNAGKSVEVMPVADHEATVAELENRVVCKRQAFEVAEGGRKLWMERAEKAEAELRAARQMGAGLVTALNAKQADEPMTERARVAAQDRGAQLGMLRTQTDAYALGECGIAALRAALEVPDA